MEQILLIGGGGHAKSVADSIRQAGQYRIAGYIDKPELKGQATDGISFIGTDNDLQAFYDAGIRNAFVTIGYMGKRSIREKLYRSIRQIGYHIPVIIDPSAVLADDVELGEGAYIGKRAVVNAGAAVGKLCIINTGAVVEHNDEIGDFSHVAVGSVLCGCVKIGKSCLIGAGATVIQGVSVGDGAVVGAGVTVRHEIEAGQTYYGK